MEKRTVKGYTDADGAELTIGDYGNSSRREFDACLSSLPALIAKARGGDSDAGEAANKILWHLANESIGTRQINGIDCLWSFGKEG